MASKLSQLNCNVQIGNKKIPFSSDFSIILQIQGAALPVTCLRLKAKTIEIDNTPKLPFLNTISPEFMDDLSASDSLNYDLL